MISKYAAALLLLPLCACASPPELKIMETKSEKEGYLSFKGRQIWYKVVGEKDAPGKLPVLCLHGGPGANSLYFKPLEALAASGRRVIFYDQLGCGKSDRGPDAKLLTVPSYVEELGEVRRQLGLGKVHLYGQSWGGMLAMEYYLAGNRQGVASLILSDSLASFDQWMSEASRLRAELPPDVQAVLKKHEDAGTTADPSYQEAMMAYYNRHLFRGTPWPDFLNESFGQVAADVYGTMWGPSEFFANGSLKGWTVRSRLGEIKAPTLILSGRYDESTPLINETLNKGIPGSKWVLFENSAHLPHIEETGEYLKVLEGFLSSVEMVTAK